ncbi:MAG: hypothetical protein LRS49_04140 [Desulfurococcales archaeon]|nr:hypothetical protein [Desulfurococcales archaeon]
MSGGYVDLSVTPRGVGDLKAIASTARRMGYTVLGAPTGVAGAPTCVDGVLVVPRYVVRASTRREAARGLASAPRGALVVVEAESQDVARYAAVNKRVDVLRLPYRMLRLVDRSTARLFRERGWGLVEVSLRPITEGRLGLLARLFTALRRAEAYSVPLALVSDADGPLGLWHPYSLAGLASLSGLPIERGLALASTAPRRALARRRLGPGCPAGRAGGSA